MTPAVHLIEPYAGTASAFRHALSARPPRVVGWMGSKGTSTRTTRSLAAWTLDACGVTPGQGLASATLMDAGPWGWVWPVILHPSSALQVAEHLRRWAEETPDGRALWDRLAAVPPPENLVERVGAWLWIQGRSPSGTPVLPVEGKGWEVMNGPTQTKAARQRGFWSKAEGHGCLGLMDPFTVATRIEDLAELVATWVCLQDGSARSRPVLAGAEGWDHAGYGHLSDTAREKGFTDRLRPDLIADRVTALAALPRPWVGVYHGRCEDVPVEPFFTLPGRCVVILDPPYVPPPGEKPVTGYGVDCTWTGILDEVQRWAAACGPDDVVAVHHAYDLSDYLEGDWHAYDVTCWGSGKTEWLTLNREPSSAWRRHHRIALRHWSTEPAEQLGLGLGMAHAG